MISHDPRVVESGHDRVVFSGAVLTRPPGFRRQRQVAAQLRRVAPGQVPRRIAAMAVKYDRIGGRLRPDPADRDPRIAETPDVAARRGSRRFGTGTWLAARATTRSRWRNAGWRRSAGDPLADHARTGPGQASAPAPRPRRWRPHTPFLGQCLHPRHHHLGHSPHGGPGGGLFQRPAGWVAGGGRYVIFSALPEQVAAYCLTAYFPAMMAGGSGCVPDSQGRSRPRFPPRGFRSVALEPWGRAAGPDGPVFSTRGKDRPELYFDEGFRNGISSFREIRRCRST